MSQLAEAPVIPGVLLGFLEERGSVGMACSRTADRKPRIRWLSGWRAAADGRELVCLVSRGFTDGLAEEIRDNGEFAATIEHIGPHETYQFKGTVLGIEKAGPEDQALCERLRVRFADTVRKVDCRPEFTGDRLKRYIPPPEVAVRLRVREIFLQTPGPGAGRRLVPPEPA